MNIFYMDGVESKVDQSRSGLMQLEENWKVSPAICELFLNPHNHWLDSFRWLVAQYAMKSLSNRNLDETPVDF